MQKNKLETDLQERVRGYIEHMYEEDKSKKKQRQEFLSLMPEVLRKDIVMSLNKRSLIKNAIFGHNFDVRVLRDASGKLTEQTFCPEEVIFDVMNIALKLLTYN